MPTKQPKPEPEEPEPVETPEPPPLDDPITPENVKLPKEEGTRDLGEPITSSDVDPVPEEQWGARPASRQE